MFEECFVLIQWVVVFCVEYSELCFLLSTVSCVLCWVQWVVVFYVEYSELCFVLSTVSCVLCWVQWVVVFCVEYSELLCFMLSTVSCVLCWVQWVVVFCVEYSELLCFSAHNMNDAKMSCCDWLYVLSWLKTDWDIQCWIYRNWIKIA
jgi:hypothetical protein